jgi:hypothetical protein
VVALVQVLPPRSHVAVKQIDEVWDLHGEQLHDKHTPRFQAKRRNRQQSVGVARLRSFI